MSLTLRVASRKKAKLRIGISAASGFGKTFSALLLAYGITGDWSKIAVVDTENGSAELYSHLGEYNVITLQAPYTPDRYMEAMRACEEASMEVIIIDSASHVWEGEGGLLELTDKLAAQKYRGNSFQAWSEVTPLYQKWINAILKSPAHVITTVRRKQAHEVGTNDKGRTTVTKVGTKEVMRDGFEYELTVSFEVLNEHHIVKASKDRTGLFMGKEDFIISEETGQRLRAWADSGVEAEADTEATPATTPEGEPVQYATAAQKEHIIRLLNHPLITKQERTKMLLNINRLDEERADQAIKKLDQAIKDREDTSAVAA